MKYPLSLIFILFSLSGWAQTTPLPEKSPVSATVSSGKKLEVIPYISEHGEDGCPSNSYCSAYAGNERKKWISFAEKLNVPSRVRTERLEEFRKKSGLPLTAWVSADKQKEKDIISWDSRCLHHQKEGNVHYHAEVMAQSLYQLKERKLVVDQAYTILKGNVVRTYLIPREEYPLYVDGDDLVFLREEEGLYYALRVSPSGLTEVIEQTSLGSDDYPSEIKCPEALVNFSKEKEKTRNLYVGSPFCKQVKNIRSKEFQVFLFNKSCN